MPQRVSTKGLSNYSSAAKHTAARRITIPYYRHEYILIDACLLFLVVDNEG